jgi:hypothetical protein
MTFAKWLLERFGVEQALIGDVLEECVRGRSLLWCWRQVLTALVGRTAQDISAHGWLAMRAVATGWIVLLLTFLTLSDSTIGRWTAAIGYRSGVWWSFWIWDGLLSYSGFGLAGWIVGRCHRAHAGPMLLGYVASVLAVLAGAVAYISSVAPRPVPVPHPLFYVVSVGPPYQWRSGFVLVPVLTLLAGLAGGSQRERRGIV